MEKRIIVEPFGIVATAKEEETILQAVQRAGVKIAAYCNGQGVCGKCKVKIIEEEFSSYGGIISKQSNVSPITDSEKKALTNEEIAEGYRFACRAKVYNDIVIELPRESQIGEQVILEEGKEHTVAYEPGVRPYTITVEKPTLEDVTNDFDRVKQALLKQYQELSIGLTIAHDALKNLSFALRDGKWTVTVFILYGKEIIKVVPGENQEYYGLAIDIGTTTVAIYLCDMKDGKQIASTSLMNPQIKYGDDVLTRISYCQTDKQGCKTLQSTLFGEINDVIVELFQANKIQKDQVLEAVLVFNTVMEHIALGLAPDYIGTSPFAPAITDSVDIKAKEINLGIYEAANIHCLPIEAAFVGADNVAVLIAEEPYKQEKMKLIIDIGTNSEICLGNSEKMYSTSCATGPALEGAQIYCGMRAARGAISKVVIDPVTLEPEITVINNTLYPIGICGSGILDAVTQMALTGILDPDGKFSKYAETNRIRTDQYGKKEYVLYFAKHPGERDIVVKQKDVRAVQLAKAALYAGSKALMKKFGIDSVDEVILAGGFGSYIDKENALCLGMFPDCELDKVTVSGNAAGMGAKLALLNVGKRKEAREIARKITYVETATDMDYQMMFADAMSVPHDKDSFYRNKQEKWQCTRHPRRTLPREVLNDGKKNFTDYETLEAAMSKVCALEKQGCLHLPLMQNIEAIAYGGIVSAVGEVLTIRDYAFHSVDELNVMHQSLLDSTEIQNLLHYIKEHKEEPILLDVEGPFTILAGLMGFNNILKAYRKNKEQLIKVIDKITEDLAAYIKEAIACGADIISLADPEGAIDLLGKSFYEEISGYAMVRFMSLIEPELKKALVHICGKSSQGLIQTGYVVQKRYRVSDKPYQELLLELAKDRKTKFVGNACLNQPRLSVPLITKLELSSKINRK